MKRIAPAFLSVALLVACEPSNSGAVREVVQRDSAGVAITEVPGPIWSEAARWTTSAEPVVEIGALEGRPEYLFSGIRGVTGLADGRIVVADGGSNTLRWYDDSGSYLFERGGSGEGPGEFNRVGLIVRGGGDTLAITDFSVRRITEYTPEGELVRTIPIDGVTVPGAAYRLRDGTFIVGSSGFSSTQMTGDEEGLRRTPEPLIRFGDAMETPDTIGIFPGPEMYFSGRGFGFHPFSRGFHYAVKDERLFVAAAEGFVVDAYEADGRWVQSIRAPDVDLQLTPGMIETYRQGAREAAAEQSEARAEAMARELEEMYFPETRPAYARFVASDDALWLEEHRAGRSDGLNRWAVLGHNGEFRGIAVLPPGFILHDVQRDHVIGTWTDDLGVEYVRKYRLVTVD
ncbi:MAG: 6-bladed beta-propeller [Longimicrobiales bacterium]|nr:6-bladed beta-propeller [Longimicrobiales bacterium]